MGSTQDGCSRILNIVPPVKHHKVQALRRQRSSPFLLISIFPALNTIPGTQQEYNKHLQVNDQMRTLPGSLPFLLSALLGLIFLGRCFAPLLGQSHTSSHLCEWILIFYFSAPYLSFQNCEDWSERNSDYFVRNPCDLTGHRRPSIWWPGIALSNRIFCNEGNVLNLLCPITQPPCDNRAFEM